jgi:hypothetical protein
MNEPAVADSQPFENNLPQPNTVWTCTRMEEFQPLVLGHATLIGRTGEIFVREIVPEDDVFPTRLGITLSFDYGADHILEVTVDESAFTRLLDGVWLDGPVLRFKAVASYDEWLAARSALSERKSQTPAWAPKLGSLWRIEHFPTQCAPFVPAPLVDTTDRTAEIYVRDVVGGDDGRVLVEVRPAGMITIAGFWVDVFDFLGVQRAGGIRMMRDYVPYEAWLRSEKIDVADETPEETALADGWGGARWRGSGRGSSRSGRRSRACRSPRSSRSAAVAKAFGPTGVRRWEYQLMPHSIPSEVSTSAHRPGYTQAELNHYGNMGWEIIASGPSGLIMRRPLYAPALLHPDGTVTIPA